VIYHLLSWLFKSAIGVDDYGSQMPKGVKVEAGLRQGIVMIAIGVFVVRLLELSIKTGRVIPQKAMKSFIYADSAHRSHITWPSIVYYSVCVCVCVCVLVSCVFMASSAFPLRELGFPLGLGQP
jgi:hypothetical protein